MDDQSENLNTINIEKLNYFFYFWNTCRRMLWRTLNLTTNHFFSDMCQMCFRFVNRNKGDANSTEFLFSVYL